MSSGIRERRRRNRKKKQTKRPRSPQMRRQRKRQKIKRSTDHGTAEARPRRTRKRNPNGDRVENTSTSTTNSNSNNNSIPLNDNSVQATNSTTDATTNTSSTFTTYSISNAHSISMNSNSSHSQIDDRLAEINGDLNEEDEAVVAAFMIEEEEEMQPEDIDMEPYEEEFNDPEYYVEYERQEEDIDMEPYEEEFNDPEYCVEYYGQQHLNDYQYHDGYDAPQTNAVDVNNHQLTDHEPDLYQPLPSHIVRNAADLLKLQEFQQTVNQDDFNEDFFIKYFDQILKNKVAFRHQNQFIYPGFDEATQQLKTNQLFRCEWIPSEDTYFCHCKLWKQRKLCWHGMLSKIGSDHEKYRIRRILTLITEQHNLNSDDQSTATAKIYKFFQQKDGLSGRRLVAFLVYDYKGDAEVVFLNTTGTISCLKHAGGVCTHSNTLLGKLNLTIDNYKRMKRNKRQPKQKKKPFEIQDPVSYKKVPVPSAFRISRTVSEDEEKYYECLIKEEAGHHFAPDDEECKNKDCQASFLDRNNYTIKTNEKAWLFGHYKAFPCKIDTWICRDCDEVHYFDGGNMKIFNWDNSALFIHDLLNDMTQTLHCNQAPAFTSWIKIKTMHYENNYSEKNFPTGPTMKKIWNSFTQRIQDWKWRFKCAHCGDEPKQVMYDGCVIYIQSYEAESVVNPTKVIDPNYKVKIRVHCNRYITVRDLREMVQRWLRLRFKKRPRDAQNVLPLAVNDIDVMMRRLQNENNGEYRACAEFIQWVEDRHATIRQSQDVHFRENIKSFLRTLSSDEPVNQFMHPAIHDIFLVESESESGSSVGTERNKLEIRKWSPLLYRLLFSNYAMEELPKELILPLLKSMAKKGHELHSKYKEQRKKSENRREPDPKQFSEEGNDDWMRKGSYYSLPKKRDRPLYSIDDKKVEEVQDGNGCNKTFFEKHKVSGGIFIVRCLEHSIALGFHIIPVGEGRNDAFSSIFTHWTVAPFVMSGDWNCQMQPYVMKREPEFFEKTLFSVDGTHCNSHTACSDAFDGALIKEYGYPLWTANWNDQGVEQRNRVLQALKMVSKNMCLEQFMITVRQKLEMDNRRLIRSIKGMSTY